MKTTLVVTALLLGLVRVAGAQSTGDSTAIRLDDRVVLDAGGPASLDDTRPGAETYATPTAARPLIETHGRHRQWLGSISLELGSSRFQARPGSGVAMPGRKINRTFLPIPVFRWERYAPLILSHGYVAIDPSLVIGKRLTWSPELARGGRTFGIAVRMRIWFDKPPASGEREPQPTTQDRILSTLRAVLDK